MHLLIALLTLAAAPAQAPACPPAGHSKASLQALKAKQFAVSDAAERMTLADGLLACLGDPDPDLRDGIAYEAFTQWMRDGRFDASALRGLRDRLYATLDRQPGAGFHQPFAALLLAEVARTDRTGALEGWMSAAERTAMVDRAAAFVESVRDYRGYVDGEGWRHGVAHGADWLMQLALNPALARPQVDRLLAAVAAQAVPERGHAYIFGEPGRLVRPVLFAARRGLLSAAEWNAWFAALIARLGRPGPDGYAAWQARRHDLTAFLSSAYVETDTSEDAGIRALKPAIVAAMKIVP